MNRPPLIVAAAAFGAVCFAAPVAGDPEKGNEIFDEQCAQCHHAYEEGKKVGPGMKWLFIKGKLESDGRPVSEATVMDKIEKGGKGMPPFKGSFSDQDKADLLAYLKTL